MINYVCVLCDENGCICVCLSKTEENEEYEGKTKHNQCEDFGPSLKG